MTATQQFTEGLRIVEKDIAQGFFEITHNGFALLGLAVMFAIITLPARPEIRQAGEIQLMGWLQNHVAVLQPAHQVDFAGLANFGACRQGDDGKHDG